MSLVRYRPDIDGLRALAVLPVLLFHVDPRFMPGGYLGVDIFFVISGYLISLILYREQDQGSLRIAAFYGRRIRRLFPALLLVIGASLAFGFFALLADEFRTLGRDSVTAIVFLLNFRLMGQAGYFDVVSYSKPLLHLWSLSVEEQFYLVWPLLLLILAWMRVRLAWALGFGLVLSLGFAAWYGVAHPESAYYHPLTRFWELLAGASIAWLQVRQVATKWASARWALGAAHALSILGLLLTASALLYLEKTVLHPGWATVWPVLGVVLLIASGPAAWANRMLALRPLVLVGLISYPLYLWHWPLLSYVRIMESGRPSASALWLAAALSLLLAWATYRWFELPVRNAMDRVRVTRLLLLSMVAMAAVSIAVVARDGWPDRPTLRKAKAFELDRTRQIAQDDGCLKLFKPDAAPTYCRQQLAGDKVLALVGDSHAHALFAGVAERAKEQGHGTLLLANSGCPPLLGTTWGRTAESRLRCVQDIDTILGKVLEDPRVDSVVIATRGPIYLSGTGYGPAEADYKVPPIMRVGAAIASDPALVFALGLQATVARLRQRGMRVTYLLQPPEQGVSPSGCLARPITLSHRGDKCFVRMQDYAVRMAPYRALVRELAVTLPSLRVVDPEPLLCADGICYAVSQRRLLYADDNHLSVSGSRLIAPLVVQQALQGLPG